MSDTGADFASVVDMAESNFLTYLPQVLECIKNCDFIAFDLEFSGTDYKPYFRSVYADTVRKRDSLHCVVRNALRQVPC